MLSYRKGKKTELETMRTYSVGMTSWQGSSPKHELSVPRGLGFSSYPANLLLIRRHSVSKKVGVLCRRMLLKSRCKSCTV